MRRIVLILFALFFSTSIFATGQASDDIYIDGQLWKLLGRPIGADSALYVSLSSCLPENICHSTANWDGFIGCWSVKDDLLVLDSVTYELFVDGKCVDATLPDSTLKRVFHTYCEKGIIVARWFTAGKIRLANGERIRYEHMGFDRNYETEMLLTIENGRITDRELFHNRIVCKGFAFEDLSLEECFALQRELGLYVRKYPQFDHLDKVYVQLAGITVDTLGNLLGVDSIKVWYRSDQGANNTPPSLANDIIRHLKALGTWKVFYINGEYRTLSRDWWLPIRLNEIAVKPTWEGLNARPYPQWFGEAKLGIFVHWGLYSVPAYASKEGYSEWFYRGLMTGDADRKRIMSLYADTTLPVFNQYKELTKNWRAELWNPVEWARMFKEAGAKYVVLVTKHHDGYCLWDNPQQSEWNSVASGPKRNIVEELTQAVRDEGLRMGFYYSLPEWTNPRHIWMQDSDSAINDYVDNYMVPQFKELVSRYKPSLIFADGDWQNSAEQFRSQELIAWYYNLVGPDAIVNDRWGNDTQHGFKTPEYSAGINVTDRPWAECRGLGRSFGLNRNEDLDNYLTSTELIQHFCELVAAGGGLTLNVGPYADGTIPLLQQERLRDLGQWLQLNGEAIYGTHTYSVPCQRVHMTAAMPHTTTIDYNWVRNAPLKGMPVDNFTVHWRGVTFPPYKKGDYILRVEGDDEIWVVSGHDTILYYNHAWAKNDKAQTTYHFDGESVYTFDVILKEKDLESTAHLSYSHDGGKSFVPLYADLQGTAEWYHTMRCFTQKGNDLYVIEFEQPDRKHTFGLDRRLQKDSKITLLGTTGTLKWKQKKNGTLTVDLSNLDPKELNSLNHAWVFKITNAITQ